MDQTEPARPELIDVDSPIIRPMLERAAYVARKMNDKLGPCMALEAAARDARDAVTALELEYQQLRAATYLLTDERARSTRGMGTHNPELPAWRREFSDAVKSIASES